MCPADLSCLLLSGYCFGCEAATLRKPGSSPRVPVCVDVWESTVLWTPHDHIRHRKLCSFTVKKEIVSNTLAVTNKKPLLIHGTSFCSPCWCILFPPLSKANNFVLVLCENRTNLHKHSGKKKLFHLSILSVHNATPNVNRYALLRVVNALSTGLSFFSCMKWILIYCSKDVNDNTTKFAACFT